MTTTDPSGQILDWDALEKLAPNISVADVFRLALRDNAGQSLGRWRASDVLALAAEHDEADHAELTNRPAWATEEGEWNGDQIVWGRDMANGTVRIDRTLIRHGEAWTFKDATSAFVKIAHEDLDVAKARRLLADLSEALEVMESER